MVAHLEAAFSGPSEPTTSLPSRQLTERRLICVQAAAQGFSCGALLHKLRSALTGASLSSLEPGGVELLGGGKPSCAHQLASGLLAQDKADARAAAAHRTSSTSAIPPTGEASDTARGRCGATRCGVVERVDGVVELLPFPSAAG